MPLLTRPPAALPTPAFIRPPARPITCCCPPVRPRLPAGILRALVDPSWLSRIAGPVPHTTNRFVHGTVVSISPGGSGEAVAAGGAGGGGAIVGGEVVVEVSKGTVMSVPFDFLLIGSGSTPPRSSPGWVDERTLPKVSAGGRACGRADVSAHVRGM